MNIAQSTSTTTTPTAMIMINQRCCDKKFQEGASVGFVGAGDGAEGVPVGEGVEVG